MRHLLVVSVLSSALVLLAPSAANAGDGRSVRSAGVDGRHPLKRVASTLQRRAARAGRLFWSGGFERGNLSLWPRTEGDVQVVGFDSRYVAKVTTTNSPDSSVGGDASYLETDSYTLPWEMNGSNSWYRLQLYLPSGQFAPAASSAGWDMFMEWHNSPGCDWADCKEYSPYVGIDARGTHLLLRWVGGASTDPIFTRVIDPRRLLYDHWYDIVVHAVLSPKPDAGYVAWWVDHRRIDGRHLATLFTRPDGSVSSVELEVGHYRSTEASVDVNYIGGILVGSTASSIRFKAHRGP
jgi:hypothetical protein